MSIHAFGYYPISCMCALDLESSLSHTMNSGKQLFNDCSYNVTDPDSRLCLIILHGKKQRITLRWSLKIPPENGSIRS